MDSSRHSWACSGMADCSTRRGFLRIDTAGQEIRGHFQGVGAEILRPVKPGGQGVQVGHQEVTLIFRLQCDVLAQCPDQVPDVAGTCGAVTGEDAILFIHSDSIQLNGNAFVPHGDERIIASAVPPRLSWLTKNPTGDAEGFGASFTREVRHVGGYTLALLTGADPAGVTRSLFRPATQRSIRFRPTCGVFTWLPLSGNVTLERTRPRPSLY